MADSQVKHTVDAGVLRIVIDRPEARNALSKRMYGTIRDLYRRAYVEDSITAVVIEGSHGAFAVGGDLHEMLASLDRDGGVDLFGYDECLPFEAVRSLPKPTIAAVDGLCFGGGLTLALVSDIIIATQGSTFAMPEARVGIVDGHLPRLLRDRVPPAWLRYWLYSGVTFSVDDAFAAGLVTKVVPADELQATVTAVLSELGRSSLSAISRYKKVLNETRPLSSMEDAYETLFTDEVRDRIRAFAARSKKK
jgi:enoyl-CoA hydratase/carnithine racemase